MQAAVKVVQVAAAVMRIEKVVPVAVQVSDVAVDVVKEQGGNMKKPLKGSWKTTAIGILGGIVILANQAIAFLDTDPETVFSFGQVAAALGMFGIGIFSRDNDKSSEEVGAKK